MNQQNASSALANQSLNNNNNGNNMLCNSFVIKSRWKIEGKIGQGAFGETYSALDMSTNMKTAIKVERLDNKKMVLKLEVIALKKLQPCPHVVRYVHSGRQDDFNFLVMEQLGENLAELKKKCPNVCIMHVQQYEWILMFGSRSRMISTSIASVVLGFSSSSHVLFISSLLWLIPRTYLFCDRPTRDTHTPYSKISVYIHR